MDERNPAPEKPVFPPAALVALPAPWPGFTRALRRLSHNVRNHLNTAELELSFAREIAADPEVRDSLTRIHQSFGKITRELDNLLGRVAETGVELIELSDDEALQAVRQDVERHLGTGTPVHWEKLSTEQETLQLDPELLCRAVRELLDNAIRYRSDTGRSIRVRAGTRGGVFTLEIIEPKKEKPEMLAWGLQPFTGTDPARYGLGLWAVRQWVATMGGTLEREYDEGHRLLVTRLRLPSGRASDGRPG